MKKALGASAAGLCLLLTVGAASTALAQETLSFRGTFTTDNQADRIEFVVGAPSDIIIRSWSYAGGVNGAGETIGRGGFDPTLSLFDSTGAFLAVSFDGLPNQVASDTVTGRAYDAYLEFSLAAGSYIAVVTQWDNTPSPRIPRGPTFTSFFGCSQGFFCDDLRPGIGTNRTGNWAVDVVGLKSADPTPSPVPLPAGLWLFGSAIAACGGAKALRRRKSKSVTP
jgi:hypothetical protein